MTPSDFKANSAVWQDAAFIGPMLQLLLHLDNGRNVTVASLAADFAERTLPYAGSSKPHVARCVTAVRTWAKCPTSDNLQECKDAASSSAAYAAYAASSSAADAAYAAYAAADAAYAAAAAAYAAAAANAGQAEQNWQLAHVRTKHPLTEL